MSACLWAFAKRICANSRWCVSTDAAQWCCTLCVIACIDDQQIKKAHTVKEHLSTFQLSPVHQISRTTELYQSWQPQYIHQISRTTELWQSRQPKYTAPKAFTAFSGGDGERKLWGPAHHFKISPNPCINLPASKFSNLYIGNLYTSIITKPLQPKATK